MHPNRPARSSCGETSQRAVQRWLDRNHDLQPRLAVNLETEGSQQPPWQQNGLRHQLTHRPLPSLSRDDLRLVNVQKDAQR
jgi:hypothetical protein